MEQKSKILMINYLFPPLGGGGGVASQTIAKGFVEAGYEVDYITTRINDLSKYEIIDGISVYRVSVWGTRATFPANMVSIILFPFVAFWRGLRLCFKNKYSYLNSHFVLPAGVAGFLLSKLFSIPHIISIHGGDIYDPTQKRSPHQYFITRKLIQFLLNHTDKVIAQSNDTKNNCEKYYKPKRSIEVIPLPYIPNPLARTVLASGERKALGLDSGKKYLIGVGMLVPRKGFDTFLRALALLPEHVEGVIIGDGPELPHLQSLARELSITSRIHFPGAISNEQKLQYLSCADIFLLTSIHEGFGIVLQEAMAAGLPIVATNNGGQTDFVVDGKNGFLVPVGGHRAIAEKVIQILSTPDLATAMRLQNLETIKTFSPEKIIPQILDPH